MALEVDTKDCTALFDDEVAEMAKMTVDDTDEDIDAVCEEITKQRSEWVLVSHARDGDKLHAYGFCTLERVGGDPTILLGLAAVRPSNRAAAALRMMVADQMRRAVLAFPDEDVLLGCQMTDAAAMEAFKPLHRVVPRPGYEANAEDRQWGRRLAKRFSVRGNYSAKEFKVTGEGLPAMAIRYAAAKKVDAKLTAMFDGVDADNGDALVVFGWALREELTKLL